MADHDPLCASRLPLRIACDCERVRRIRADERERLRAQVEALRDQALAGFHAQPHRSHLGTRAAAYADVLRLLGGESDD